MTKVTMIAASTGLSCGVVLAQKKLGLKDLPDAVHKTVQAELKGGEIRNISKETEDGVAQYEIETVLNGKHRDFNVDMKGKLLVVEEETSIDSIPATAKTSIIKLVGSGKLGIVELFMRGGESPTDIHFLKMWAKIRCECSLRACAVRLQMEFAAGRPSQAL